MEYSVLIIEQDTSIFFIVLSIMLYDLIITILLKILAVALFENQ